MVDFPTPEGPETTIILAEAGSSGHLPQIGYYLPEYRSYNFQGLSVPGAKQVLLSRMDRTLTHSHFESPLVLLPNVKNIILFDRRYVKANQMKNAETRVANLNHDLTITWLEPQGHHSLYVDTNRIWME